MPQERNIPTNRPATVVTIGIKIDGNEIARTYQVDSITVRKEINRVAWAKLIILDGAPSEGSFRASNEQLFIPGKEIEILSGYQNDNYTLFKGLIVRHSVKLRGGGASQLVLECRDKVFRMTIGRKSRYFQEMKDSDVISQIAGSYSGIDCTAEATRVTHKELVQYDCTDWDFIVSRADANGRICLNDDGTLAVKSPDLAQSPVLSLLYGATILEFDAEIDARHQLKKVTSQAWSHSDQDMLKSEGSDPNVNLIGNMTSAQLAEVSGLQDYILDHGGRVEEAELQAWADSLVLKRQLAKVRGRVKCKGVHTVKPGMLVELGGIGDRFNGKAFVSGIQHFIAAGDWQLDIQFGLDPVWFAESAEIHDRPASALLAAIHGLQVGIVTQIHDDPDSENRIKVRFPVISTSEDGIWARLATLDAGNERGTFFLPEIGDEVIVGFINDDPRDAIVLGMMHSSALPAPLTAEDSNPKKGLVTRSRMKMIFDDDLKQFLLETPAGKKVILDEDADEITISDDHQNKLVMNADGISIESLGEVRIKAQKDIKIEGINVETKAQASLRVEGSASAEVKAGGSLTLKGSLIQIN